MNTLAEGPVLAIKQADDVLAGMDEWNTKQHNHSGLVERVRNSTINEQQAAQQTIEFLQQYVPQGASPMCGNSICQDRRFLYPHMRDLEEFFHYRNFDVSTLKEVAKRWYPAVYEGYTKESSHLALDDIRDSISEMKYYRESLFK